MFVITIPRFIPILIYGHLKINYDTTLKSGKVQRYEFRRWKANNCLSDFSLTHSFLLRVWLISSHSASFLTAISLFSSTFYRSSFSSLPFSFISLRFLPERISSPPFSLLLCSLCPSPNQTFPTLFPAAFVLCLQFMPNRTRTALPTCQKILRIVAVLINLAFLVGYVDFFC